jgi:hypothetical protein
MERLIKILEEKISKIQDDSLNIIDAFMANDENAKKIIMKNRILIKKMSDLKKDCENL